MLHVGYGKILNISNFWAYIQGAYIRGIILGGVFWVSGRLLYTKNENLLLKASEKDKSKYKDSAYALSMFIHYPIYEHRSSNISPGLIFGGGGLIRGRIFELVYRMASIRGIYIRDFTVFLILQVILFFH